MNHNIGPRPIQKIGIHLLLALFTIGMGNALYYLIVKQKQKQWDVSIKGYNTSYSTNDNNININGGLK